MKTPEEYVEAAALFDDRWLRANLAMLIARVQRDALSDAMSACRHQRNGHQGFHDSACDECESAIRALLPKEPS